MTLTQACSTYANGRTVTPTDPLYRSRDQLETAYKAGQTDALTRYLEEIPPELRGLHNRLRTLCTRPQASNRLPLDIITELGYEFRDPTFDPQ